MYALALASRTRLPLKTFVCAWFDDKDYFQFFRCTPSTQSQPKEQFGSPPRIVLSSIPSKTPTISGKQVVVSIPTLVVQFRSSDDLDIDAELAWRNEIAAYLNGVVMKHEVGAYGGGQHGYATIDLFFMVNDVNRAAELIIEALTERELISWVKIASSSGDDWYVHYPPGADFRLWT